MFCEECHGGKEGECRNLLWWEAFCKGLTYLVEGKEKFDVDQHLAVKRAKDERERKAIGTNSPHPGGKKTFLCGGSEADCRKCHKCNDGKYRKYGSEEEKEVSGADGAASIVGVKGFWAADGGYDKVTIGARGFCEPPREGRSEDSQT